MKVIGITGGIGSGKSTVIDVINENYDCYIMNTDQMAAHLMQKGNAAYVKTVEYFGKEILQEDGEIDRKKLAQRVFKSEMELLKLNSFTHPLVREEILRQIEQEKAKSGTSMESKLIIVETALPYEAHLKDYCDEIWYVTASLEVRRERLMQHRNYSVEKINDIFNKQLTEMAYKEFSTHVLVNDTTKEEILRQVREFVAE